MPLSFTGTDLSVPIKVHGNEWRKELVNVHGSVSPKIDVPDVPMDAKCSAAVDVFAYQQGVVARFELVLAHPLITISLISASAVSADPLEILVPVWEPWKSGLLINRAKELPARKRRVLLSSILSCISFIMVEEVSELEDETSKDFAEHLFGGANPHPCGICGPKLGELPLARFGGVCWRDLLGTAWGGQ